MRLFVALDMDEAIQQRLDDYVRTLLPRLPGVRFVRSSTYHITLQFLGEVADAELIRARLREVRTDAFPVTVAGVGFFPNARAPRVFWAGVDAPALLALAQKIGQSLDALGFKQEGSFHPHLTLARSGSGRPKPLRGERPSAAFAQLPGIVASSPAPEFGTMTARHFFLFESRLSPSGPNYSKVEGFELVA